MIDFERARATMVESQLRTDRVTDRRILSAFAALPRERFVPAEKRELAYSDASLEVWPSIDGAPARFLLPPVVLARLVQLAAVEANDAVLDVGCATGYSAAVLSRVAKRVIALEDDPTLAEFAMQTFRALGLDRIEVVVAAPALGHPALAPYQAIIVNGRLRRVPDELVRQLAPAGRLAAAIGEGVTSPATVLTRAGKSWSSRREFDMFVPAAAGFPDSDGGFAF
jgi:protein-L-isoaspartate(D-aspartate) O-methyltransferase